MFLALLVVAFWAFVLWTIKFAVALVCAVIYSVMAIIAWAVHPRPKPPAKKFVWLVVEGVWYIITA